MGKCFGAIGGYGEFEPYSTIEHWKCPEDNCFFDLCKLCYQKYGLEKPIEENIL